LLKDCKVWGKDISMSYILQGDIPAASGLIDPVLLNHPNLLSTKSEATGGTASPRLLLVNHVGPPRLGSLLPTHQQGRR